MNIQIDVPPNYQEIIKVFPEVRNRSILFTYGQTLFNPMGGNISPDLLIHEDKHAEQQSTMIPEEWWNKYLTDPEFRLSQEVFAYRAQYEYAQKNYTREHRRRLLQSLARDLSSPIYGNLCSFKQAKDLISR